MDTRKTKNAGNKKTAKPGKKAKKRDTPILEKSLGYDPDTGLMDDKISVTGFTDPKKRRNPQKEREKKEFNEDNLEIDPEYNDGMRPPKTML